MIAQKTATDFALLVFRYRGEVRIINATTSMIPMMQPVKHPVHVLNDHTVLMEDATQRLVPAGDSL